MSVLVFDYMGAAAGNHLLKDVKLDTVVGGGSGGGGNSAPANTLGDFVQLESSDSNLHPRSMNSRQGQNENVRSKLFGEFFKLRSTTCVSILN